ncbi:hypothetical protein T440DRAFT_496566 [Plenodomus tracheiphilus IPT5]|uniref:Transcription factor IIIC putative zinc-finger domain-containing protein n=1 Tax=Plenodomus tracheiphilus IPT5 TaxID=1408161 RepID=A0A6A7BE52_9PLEO|nr:hypothetical protein T440DRAFT_496566 [Plenodomus tracheiphilus IPT5]
MADVTELRCWPSCVDAIDWSQDGIIALASDERVELLFPNTVNFERDQDVPQWQHVPLKVPLFSTDELPLKEPAPIQSFSIGEEISNSAPTSIAWSSPGLAKHRRCALAVLTSNLILSIWSTEGKPQDESSWSRRLMVNDVLRKYHRTHVTEPSHHVLPLDEEKVRLRSRIRAFAWAPPLPSHDRACVVGTHLSYGQHIVAVSNDDNQVAFITIHSPASTNGLSRRWSAEVLTHVLVTPPSEGLFSCPNVFEDMLEQQRHISNLGWSPWIFQNGQYQSVLVYSTNHNVRARVVRHVHGSIELSDEVVYPNIELRFNGPMRWLPRVEDGEKLRIAMFTTAGLLCLTISALDASIIQTLSHDLDGRWDEISGVIWDIAQQPTPKLHISSLASTLKTPTAVLEVSSGGLVRSGFPMWRDQIENNLALFSVKNDLKGNSRARLWGLTLSPLGDFVATTHSVHPSDMIEYGPPGDRRSTVAISTLRKYSELREAFPSLDVSAESVIFTTKKLAQKTVEDAEQMPDFTEEMVDKLLQTYTSPPGTESSNDILSKDSGSKDLIALVEAFKKVAYLDEHSLKDRYTILVNQACNAGSAEELPRTLIAYRLASASQYLPPSLSETPFSAEIRTHHQQLASLINALTATDNTQEKEHSPTLPESQDQNTTTTNPLISASTSPTDTCDFCSAHIPFTDLTSAACTNGHTFPRCGLSFLSIQAPGITKYCGVCSTPYLNEEFVAAQEVGEMGNDGPMQRDGDDGRVENALDASGGMNGGGTEGMGRQDNGGENGVDGGDEAMQDSQGIDVGEEVATKENDQGIPLTLAKILFLACDACIYCGGKFVG